MSTPARIREAEQAGIAFQAALLQIGATTIVDALKLWAQVPVQLRASVAATWLEAAIQAIMARRGMARALAMAYYRLVRALITGTTIADPRKPEPPYVTLDELRRQFAELAGEPAASSQAEGTAPAAEGTDETATPAESGVDEDLESDVDEDEVDRIIVEEIEGLAQAEAQAEREARAEIELALSQLGANNLANKVDAIDTSKPASQVDAERAEAHAEAGARQAAAAARIAMNGGRQGVTDMSNGDDRVIGYVRLSSTGTPCGWCAMLISRGFVRKDAYTSQQAAGPTLQQLTSGEYAEGDKYHDNCKCYAEPIFASEQYSGSSRYDLNRYYAEMWPKVTAGLSGKAAVSAWRSWIRAQQKAAAQAAAA